MKVCFIDWFAYPLFNPRSTIVFGGAQIQLYFLARELAKKKNFRVSFLTDNQFSRRQDLFGSIKVYQMIRSPKTPGLPGRLINLTGFLYFFIRLWRQLRQIGADVYFQRAASAETGLIALVCRLLHKHFVYMVAHEQDVNGDFVRANGWRGKLFSLGLKLTDKIICQTKEQQKMLVKPLQDKSLVIPSGYPLKPARKQNKQGVLWVARAEKWKGPELLIELAQSLPGEKFIMICQRAENDPDYFDLIKRKAKPVKNLAFIPGVSFGKIDSYFAKAKVFVSTSSSEGFPNTFIQAAKNMTPIVSLKVNPDKFITGNGLGYCAGGKKQKMVELLEMVFSNRREWQRMAVNAYRYAAKNHDIKQTAGNITANILTPLASRKIRQRLSLATTGRRPD